MTKKRGKDDERGAGMTKGARMTREGRRNDKDPLIESRPLTFVKIIS